MSAPKNIELAKIVNSLRSLRTNINVPLRFHDRMTKIHTVLDNDKTGIVNTVLDFMIHAATVPMRIETQNTRLDANLKIWQTSQLNKNVNIDIPRGLRAVSIEYYRERLYSSFVALNVKWGRIRLNDGSTFEVPTHMWVADGSKLYVESNDCNLNTKQYYIGCNENQKKLTNTRNTSVFIRKPFDPLYQAYPTPFFS